MGKLIQVATSTVSSPTASVILTGIDSDDVYMLAITNMDSSNTTASSYHYPYIRFTESGTPNTTPNYDAVGKLLYSGGTYTNISNPNNDDIQLNLVHVGTGTNQTVQGIYYIYNAYNNTEFTYCTIEGVGISTSSSNELYGGQGGAVLKQATQVDGVELSWSSSQTITSGTFTLFKVI
jgi:hypothetical protein